MTDALHMCFINDVIDIVICGVKTDRVLLICHSNEVVLRIRCVLQRLNLLGKLIEGGCVSI